MLGMRSNRGRAREVRRLIALPEGALPPALVWSASGAYGLVLISAARRAPWARLREGEMQHVFFGAAVVLLFLWTIRGSVVPGLGVHFLGATVLTLMFGWRLALVAMALALAGAGAYGLSRWELVGLNGLLATVLPVGVSHGVLRAVERWLPPHLFIYIFLAGFFGAALAMAASVTAQVVLLVLADGHGSMTLTGAYLPFLPLLMLPEAFLNGALVTALVGMRPRWIWTFDDTRYLRDR